MQLVIARFDLLGQQFRKQEIDFCCYRARELIVLCAIRHSLLAALRVPKFLFCFTNVHDD